MSVFVWIETFGGAAESSSWEALGAAQSLADALGTDTTAIVFGEKSAAIAADAGKFGVASAIICNADEMREYRLETYAALLGNLVDQHKPAAVVAVATSRGRELLASAAADNKSGLIAEVIDLRVEDGSLVGTRPAYAGKVLMEMTSRTVTTFLTVRGRAFPPPPVNAAVKPSVTQVSPATIATELETQIDELVAELGAVNLSDAAIIVSGGRGMANNPAAAPAGLKGEEANIWKAKEGFAKTLQPLADVLGAAIGASRAAVDAGYIPYEHQVGQTGKVVTPDLYVACGISGAIQHQAGMRGSKIIVAINKDAEAPIFKLARYGIVGDLYDVVPALTDALRARLS
ncbi:MAG: electron transfer flavoprotein subunit alpha/FixB family protein [Chloroflexi bacterium]|nr:electron transfer flavoprotein subunit alpha/FixB family protein [Chloroflexota bacterium]